MAGSEPKSGRILWLYQELLAGRLLNKQQCAERYRVNIRSIQRDIDSIRAFLSERAVQNGVRQELVYDRRENAYRLIAHAASHLSNGEVLALCKILLESRAFTKAQLERQLQSILDLCVSAEEKEAVEWFIRNELFHYRSPAHPEFDPDTLWAAAQAIRSQSVLSITYLKLKDQQPVERCIEPVGLMFSEYYFYLVAYIADADAREGFHKKNDPYPTIYRIDRIRSLQCTGEHFSVDYKARFQEGAYKNRVQYMFGGEPQRIAFEYSGPSVEAVLDRFPMAKVVNQKEGVCSIEAEVFGTGIKMWLLSQGSKVRVTAPAALADEIRQEALRMAGDDFGNSDLLV